MKVWDYDLPERVVHQPRRGSGKSILATIRGRGRSKGSSDESIVVRTTKRSLDDVIQSAGLRDRLEAGRAGRGMRVSPGRPWHGWSPEALDAVSALRAGGGDGRLPESDGHPYELRVLHQPGRSDGPAESRWYNDDRLALQAFTTARSLLADPELGLGLAVVRNGCLVYEWTEVAASDWRDLDVAAHRRRGCPGHVGSDAFDHLARVYDRFCALGYRESGRCNRSCIDGCPGIHGDLLAAMMRAEAAEISGENAEADLPPTPGGPGGRDIEGSARRPIPGLNPRRRKGPGLIRPQDLERPRRG